MEVRVVDNSFKIKKAAKEQIVKALEMCGLLAESAAKVNITENRTVDTGNLRNSITHIVDEPKKQVMIGSAVEYAPYIEFGTGIHAEGGGGRQTPWFYEDRNGVVHRTRGAYPHPFLRPAITQNIETFRQIIKDELSS